MGPTNITSPISTIVFIKNNITWLRDRVTNSMSNVLGVNTVQGFFPVDLYQRSRNIEIEEGSIPEGVIGDIDGVNFEDIVIWTYSLLDRQENLIKMISDGINTCNKELGAIQGGFDRITDDINEDTFDGPPKGIVNPKMDKLNRDKGEVLQLAQTVNDDDIEGRLVGKYMFLPETTLTSKQEVFISFFPEEGRFSKTSFLKTHIHHDFEATFAGESLLVELNLEQDDLEPCDDTVMSVNGGEMVVVGQKVVFAEKEDKQTGVRVLFIRGLEGMLLSWFVALQLGMMMEL